MTLQQHWADAFVSLGSNIENRRDHLNRAIQFIGKPDSIQIIRISSVYETEPWGMQAQNPFLNQVARLSVRLSPQALLNELQQIEAALARKRNEKWGPRTIDLDILLYGQSRIKDGEFLIPHPLLDERRFVLTPLNEIAADYYLPKFRKTVAELLENCEDPCWVRLNQSE